MDPHLCSMFKKYFNPILQLDCYTSSMKKHLIILLTFSFLLVLSFELSAQNENPSQSIQLKGKVVDADNGLPLDYATISLYRLKDSTLIGGNVSNMDGTFSINAPAGKYYAIIEFLAYDATTLNQISLSSDQPTLDLGTISLKSQATALDEIVVTAEKSQMEMSLDKKIFNVGKDLANRGGSAADLLDNVPSVQVDVEGAVSLRGSENVRILIDGQPSGLIGNGNGLRQLQANMIEKIELITNPSARYQAEGSAGIINIILKKERKSGVNGSFDLTLGYPDNYGAAINMNYRTKKLNLFTNYGLSYRNSPGKGSLYQEIFKNDTTFITQQYNQRTRTGLNNTFRFGADYFLNPKNTLTTALTYRIGQDQNLQETDYRDFIFDANQPVGITLRTDEEQEDDMNLEYALTYKKTFERKGQELTADLRYRDKTEEEDSDLRSRFYNNDNNPDGTPDLLQQSNNKESEKLLTFQLDYVHPFSKESKFEIGLRSSIRDIDNDYLVEELSDGVWQALQGLSNNFQYDENIHAAYLIYGNKKGKFSYQFGLRPEYSQVSTRLLQTNDVNKRDYLNFFPSVHFTYDLPSENAVQISYSRRVRRPQFWDLNPFFTFSDNRNFFSGNPDLDPEFADALELGHIKYWDKGSLSSSIYYRHTNGKIDRIRRIDESGNSVTRPENLLTEDAFGFEFTASYNPVKWWRLNADFNFFRAITDGGNLGASFASDAYSWFTRGTSRFSVGKSTDVQVRFDYRAPQVNTQGKRLAMYGFDIAASQDVLKEKGTLTLSVRDLLNSRRWRYTAEGENFITVNDFQWRARSIVLSLTYRLNQQNRKEGNKGGKGNYEGGGEEGMY